MNDKKQQVQQIVSSYLDNDNLDAKRELGKFYAEILKKLPKSMLDRLEQKTSLPPFNAYYDSKTRGTVHVEDMHINHIENAINRIMDDLAENGDSNTYIVLENLINLSIEHYRRNAIGDTN